MATPNHLQRPKPQYDDFVISDDQAAPAAAVVYRTASRPAAPPEQVLIKREALDKSTPTAKAVLAVLCWMNSIGTTALTGIQIQRAVHQHYSPGTAAPFPWAGILAGFLFQLLLTFGQIYTAERSAWGYRLCLAPDAALTAWQWGQLALYPVTIALLSLVLPATPALLLALTLSATAAWMIGVYSAKLPERMVFGQRRKG